MNISLDSIAPLFDYAIKHEHESLELFRGNNFFAFGLTDLLALAIEIVIASQ